MVDIPDSWSFTRLKYLSDHIINKRHPVDGEIKISPENVESVTGRITNFYSDYDTEGSEFSCGDILFNKLRVYLNKVVLTTFDGLSMGEMIVVRPRGVDGHFLFKVMTSSWFIEKINSLSEGVKLPRPPVDGIFNVKVPCPPPHEQHLISRYLDKKTEQIDSLIEKIRRKIELLKEQRTSLIDQCVTKGLDPNVEMKDSGVEWIGEIPGNWGVSRLDFLVRLFGRLGWKSLKSDEYVDDGYVFLSTPNIKSKEIDFENVNYITKERYEESPEIMLEEGDVLLVKDGSTLGITNIVRSLPRPSTVNSSIGVLKIKSKDISPEFLYWYLSGHYIQNIIQRIKGGMGVPHLFQSDIKKFLVLLPSRDEQEIISKFINKETSKLDLITEKHHDRIRLLKEYRQSLISSVVTGKVRVTEDMI